MGADGDRRERAGNFVRGLMDEAERERAQRDLEIDPEFLGAVMDAVETIESEARGRPAAGAGSWSDIAARLGALPQMQAKARKAPPDPAEPRVTFGRRKTDFVPRPQPSAVPLTARVAASATSGSLWRAAVLALAITCAFLLGYVAGMHSARMPAAISMTTGG